MAYIDRDKAIAYVEEQYRLFDNDENKQAIVEGCVEALKFTPTADVVEVVRCKDCVNRVEFDTNKFHCELTGYYCGETGYCSDGVRKERSDT